jgi:hypothetical protein
VSSSKRVILVTGCSRSGTTAIGSNLALGLHTRYIYEPFNSQTGLECIQNHFPVPGSVEFPVELFDECVERIRTLNMNLKSGVLARDTDWRRLFKTYIGSRSRLSYLMCRFDLTLKTIIWKDPLAAFAAEAVALRHKMPIVVTVRPPIAVAASFKRMKWTPRVAELNSRLTEIGLDFAGEYIERYKQDIGQSSVASVILWRMVYSMLLRVSAQSEAIYFVNVQDFIDRPVERYRHLYNLLELPWSRKVEAAIQHRHVRSQSGKTKMEQMPQRAHIAKRNLQEINEYGRKLLSAEEIALIEAVSADVWPTVQAACVRWPQ